MTEEWRPVVGWEGCYAISSEGRVRNREGYYLATVPGGRCLNYLRVMLTRRNGEQRRRRHAYIHHLMAEAFLGPRPDGMQVCHKNDEGHDNRLENLVYGDRDTNEIDRHVAAVHTELEEAPF